MNCVMYMKSFDLIWEEIHKTSEWGKYPSEHVIRFVARNYFKCEDRSKIKILDFGCGAGSHTWFLAREGFDTYAFDGSQSAVMKVKRRLQDEQLSADVSVMDGVELQYEDSFFDSVIDNVSIYCSMVDNIYQMYAEIYRVLRVGGKLFTTAFTVNTTGFGTGEEIEKNTYRNIESGNLAGRGIAHFYERGELEQILIDIGFILKTVEFMEYDDLGNKVSMILIQAYKN